MRTSFAHFRPMLYAALAFGGLWLTGCASLPPPTAELEAAQHALQQATAADADQYAPEALATARDALQQAQASMAQGRDEMARGAALAATDAADMARIRSVGQQLRAAFEQQREAMDALRGRLQLPPMPATLAVLEQPAPTGTAEQRLQALDADPDLNAYAQYERLRARQALAAVELAKRSAKAQAQVVAERRVGIAEKAARVEAGKHVLDKLQADYSALQVEASRRDAERARAEVERLRMQTQIQAEEAARLQQAGREADLAAAREREAQLARQEAELVAGAALPPDRRDPRGQVFTLAGDAFGSGQYRLSRAAAASIRALGLYLSALPGGAVQVIGHTDSQGDAAGNLKLSEKRAQQVRAGLIAAGLDRQRVSAQGAGSTAPVADNDSASGRAKNRRVEIIVADE